LVNHLGNNMVVISDKKIGVSSNGTTIDYYNADVIAAQDYYPFGQIMPGRKFSSSSSKYRYGFNGKENDNEVKGEGNQIDYGWRVYDPRIGKFLSVDPLQSTYPELTPYQFAGNTPIQAVDLDGREIYHYTLFFQADGKAPILTYVGEQKNEMATWPLDAIDRGKSEGFKTYNGDKITTKSIQVHVVAIEGGGIAYKPAEATITFSSFKAMNDWSAAGYQGTEDEIAFIGGFQQKLEEAVIIAGVTAPSASPVSRAGRGGASGSVSF
jgi:RHS repeat-associated protein